jgi:hypothetical protein
MDVRHDWLHGIGLTSGWIGRLMLVSQPQQPRKAMPARPALSGQPQAPCLKCIPAPVAVDPAGRSTCFETIRYGQPNPD